MRSTVHVIAGLAGALALAGCHAQTRMAATLTDVPRVDLGFEGGNRGYLVGTPPQTGQMKTTRQMVEATVELPTFYKPKPGASRPAASDETEQGTVSVAPGPTPEASGPYDTYVVQKGDSLWSIAAQPEIYGKAGGWRRIFDANRDLLKNPDRLKAGMTLKIPRGTGGRSTTYGDEGITYKK